ncbi:MAG: sigma-70 family RNA polymerase sigma factor [Ruminococcaceae bacterium]|nr:sigma-70 family RNA polymerase sigma factor [Oscillospiraceae bacterium]
MDVGSERYELTAETVSDFSDAVYRLALSYTGNREDAEDVCQEVFFRLFRKRPQLESKEHCRNWLFKVTANCAKTLLTSAYRRHSSALDCAENLGTEDSYDDGAVLSAVMALPPKQRLCIHLFYYEELSIKDISNVTGLGVNTVKSHLQRARAGLKDQLKGEFGDEL